MWAPDLTKGFKRMYDAGCDAFGLLPNELSQAIFRGVTRDSGVDHRADTVQLDQSTVRSG